MVLGKLVVVCPFDACTGCCHVIKVAKDMPSYLRNVHAIVGDQ